MDTINKFVFGFTKYTETIEYKYRLSQKKKNIGSIH